MRVPDRPWAETNAYGDDSWRTDWDYQARPGDLADRLKRLLAAHPSADRAAYGDWDQNLDDLDPAEVDPDGPCHDEADPADVDPADGEADVAAAPGDGADGVPGRGSRAGCSADSADVTPRGGPGVKEQDPYRPWFSADGASDPWFAAKPGD
jgi:hypothetical protein